MCARHTLPALPRLLTQENGVDQSVKPEEQDLQAANDKGNIRIRNMLASIERTFLSVGTRIGKYCIIEEIDRGGMAVVYKALQLDLDREVALKVMPANITINRNFVERFLTEAHAVAKLSHPFIVNIHEVSVENNIYYLAMDYIPGKNLYYHLHHAKPKLVDVLEIIARLAEALQYAHDQRIIHRDLKLNNVIMKDRQTPVLIDFGLAKALEDDNSKGGITRTGEIIGSPSYMAPERILGGKVDHRSDICSLGIMLYEMLTFKNPYLDQRNLHQTTMNVMEANPIPPRKLIPWLPAEIEAITLKAMAKNADDRYFSMGEFCDEIRRYQRGEPVLAKPPSAIAKVKRFAKMHWAQIVIVSLLVSFGCITGISMHVQSKKEQSHWQLVFTEKFSGKSVGDDWLFFPAQTGNDTVWRLADGMLRGHAENSAFVQLQRRFNRDILIEFDIAADSLDLFNAGIFLFGSRPDSGYTFWFNRNGTGQHGISFPGSTFLFQEVDPAGIPVLHVNHIIIERIQHTITYTINGVVVARAWDLLPPVGKQHEHIGFFINGSSAAFDNLKIYRRAIPQAPSPTLIADRFWERGDIEAALEEYRGLLLDFSDANITCELHIKIADCLVRLNRPDEALEALVKACTGRKDDALLARTYFLEGIIYGMQDDERAADSVLRHLAGKYAANPANIAAMTMTLLRSYRAIQEGSPEIAHREINALIDYYKKYPHLWGRLHLSLLQNYISRGVYDTAYSVAEEIIAHYPKKGRYVVAAKIAQGTILLHRGQKENAKDIFDACIAAHLNDEGIWDAWLSLADIYRSDFKYHDAQTLFLKVYRESPPSTMAHWLAAVDAADCIGQEDIVRRDSLLSLVAAPEHPFPLPRLIAQLYLDTLREIGFKERWEQLYPGDRTYLYFLARKAAMRKEHVVAAIYLNELKRALPKQRWMYFKVVRILGNVENW